MATLKTVRCIILFIFVLYLKMIIANIREYQQSLVRLPHNTTIDVIGTMDPGLDWIIPTTICSSILFTVLYWVANSRDPHHIATVLTVELCLVLFGAIQLLDISPQPCKGIPNDSLLFGWPECGFNINLPAQLVLFIAILVKMVQSFVMKGLIYFFLFVVFIGLVLFQNTVDVISTMLIVQLLVSHPFLTHFSKRFFITESPYFERIRNKHVVSSI